MFHPIKKKLSHSPNIKLNSLNEITIDKVLSWNKHIENLTKKLARANGILSKLHHFIPIETALSVYHSLFQSYLLHGSLAWYFPNQGSIDRITKIQKRCIQILTFAPFDAHTNPSFWKLGIIQS